MHVSRAEGKSVPVDLTVEDSASIVLIAPYRDQLWDQMQEVIGTSATTLTREKPESTLGNWIADVIESTAGGLFETPVDFAINNYGGIRLNTFAAGPVTVGGIYELMPFDNLVVVVSMNGVHVQQLLDQIAADGGWPVSRSVRFAISQKTAIDVTIGGAALDPGKTYRVAMSDYVAQGGDGRQFLRDLPREVHDFLIRDALIIHMRDLTSRGEQLVVVKDGRVRLAGAQ